MGGGDKCLRPLSGKPILAHIIERLAPQVSALIINANDGEERFAAFGLPVVADSVEGYAGPLAGVHAGLAWTKTNMPDARHIVTVAGDTPFFPLDLVEGFRAAANGREHALAVARSEEGVHPVFGLWPVSAADMLATALHDGARKVTTWLAEHGAAEVSFPPVTIAGRAIDPFFNINRPEDLAEAEALLAPQR
ncbi:MAG: molybdenum cofactor guanylyltransferase MobA [Methyloceanibacter sp.]|uniref:molybdenum cofactor guanylyltransferase MobA n=1 Tax=Methyloceanibacter sp. TaxID=1965321 RepID=UPI003D9B4C00